MSQTINLTVELCEEDRARLDNILGTVTSIYKVIIDAQPAAQDPEPATPTEAPDFFLDKKMNLPEEEKPQVTLEEVTALVRKMLAPESLHRDAVKQLIKTYAERVSAIPQDKLPEVKDKLNALKGA